MNEPMNNTTVVIYKLEGTRQLVVSTGSEEYFFIEMADAQRFARMLAPMQDFFEVKPVVMAA